MIDLHAHVLPGIDDGPTDVRGALALARAAAAEGTRILAATPHLRADHPRVRPTELALRCARLRREIAAKGIALEIVSGAEVDVLAAREASEDDLLLASYAQRGTDILLETPYGELPRNFEDIVFHSLRARGLRVLLAHPERNRTLQRHPERLGELIRSGILIQVDASSLARTNRRSGSGRLAHGLIEERVAHVIASDAHGLGTGRPAGLRDALAAAARVDAARAEWMVGEAPAAILAGIKLAQGPGRRRHGRRRWRANPALRSAAHGASQGRGRPGPRRS